MTTINTNNRIGSYASPNKNNSDTKQKDKSLLASSKEVETNTSTQEDTFSIKSTATFGAYGKDIATSSSTPSTTQELTEEKGMDISGLIGNDYTNSTGSIDIEQMKSDMLVNYQNMIQQMLGYQQDDGSLKVPSHVQMAAQASLEGDGYWSPESVSTRILDMAKALSGGDPEKFELLKEAALKGFGAAEDAWGGELPEITNVTKDLVLKGFDDWYSELNS